jgi:DNA-binding response OmpR family regulator
VIFVVDNEPGGMGDVKTTLEAEGYEVATFDSAESALDLMTALDEPELIISESDMPGMDGFAFKRAFSRRFPNSITPFIFYTSLGDEESMGRGLALGVDDYLIKPMSPRLLATKIRNILSRKNHYLIHTFYGDLAKMPFFQIIQFCESKGLTGEVELMDKDINILIGFKAGQLQSDSTTDDTLLKVYDLTAGTFIIRSMPMDYSELKDVAVYEVEESAVEETVYSTLEKPMGKLSGIQTEKKILQIQTEFVTTPSNQVMTLVVHDGRIVNKVISPITGGKRPKQELENLIEAQHNEVEAEIKQKLSALVEQKQETSAETSHDNFKKFFDDGFSRYRAGDFDGALASWEQAYSINPTDKSLETNIRIVKKKLGR